MSDHDRLADYLRRINGDHTPRNLADGCDACGLSIVSCHSIYPQCCTDCAHA